MFNRRQISVVLLALGIFAMLSGGCATQPGSETARSTPAASPTLSPSPSPAAYLSESDRQFVTEMSSGNLAEAQLGNLAAQKAASSDVKQFAERMVDDHSRANNELQQLVSGKGLSLPQEVGSQHQAVIDQLSKLSGREFDRAYVSEMIRKHEMTVTKLESAAQQSNDADLKAWVMKILPTVREHLQMAQEIAGKIGAGPKTGVTPRQ
jgi:putative membrane protein